MTDYDTAIADMEAKLEELKQAREAEKLPERPGFYRTMDTLWHLDEFGQWRHWFGSGRFDLPGIVRSNEEMLRKIESGYGPLVPMKLVDA